MVSPFLKEIRVAFRYANYLIQSFIRQFDGFLFGWLLNRRTRIFVLKRTNLWEIEQSFRV